jgi:hypothetical protein
MLVAPEVRHEDVPGVRPERELAGRPAARARTDVAFREEPAIDELADPAGDDRPPKARPGDELRARA